MLPPRVDVRICAPVLRAGEEKCIAYGHNQQSRGSNSSKHGGSKHGGSKPGALKHNALLPVMPKAEMQDSPRVQQNEK
jgi:hypothetical protein